MNEFKEQFEIIPGQLYFCTRDSERPLQQSSQFLYLNTDHTLQYTPFFADFGPLHIGLTYNFCEQLDTLLTQGSVEKKPVIYYSSTHPHSRANSAVLICAYMIFVKGFTAEIAYEPFIGVTPILTTFRDAAFSINTYPITVLDCARAFYRVNCLHHFVYSTFDIHKHDHLAKLENGDVSWIIPGKFIAFSGPVSTPRELSPGVFALPPEGYVPLFKSLGVTCVVRFNKKCYDRNVFVRSGIKHVDLYYEDGGNPSDAILQGFLTTCENERGVIAVHCKAGLGRTGTNIAAYMMKHYGYSAKEATAWCRVCRPGCVVGPQQQYLETIQERMWLEGRRYRQERNNTNQNTPSSFARSIGKSLRLNSQESSTTQSQQSHSQQQQQQLNIEHVDSSVTSRILKKQEQKIQQKSAAMAVNDFYNTPVNRKNSRGGNSVSSKEKEQETITNSNSHNLLQRPNTSGHMKDNDGRDRRDIRGTNGNSGSNNIDWDINNLSISTNSNTRPKTSSRLSDLNGNNGNNNNNNGNGNGNNNSFNRPQYPSTTGDIHDMKQSFALGNSNGNGNGNSSESRSQRSTGSNVTNTTYGLSQSDEKINSNGSNSSKPSATSNTTSSTSTSTSFTQMLWSSTKSKMKSSSVSPSPQPSVTPPLSQQSSTSTKDSGVRKNSFGKVSTGTKKLSMK